MAGVRETQQQGGDHHDSGTIQAGDQKFCYNSLDTFVVSAASMEIWFVSAARVEVSNNPSSLHRNICSVW